MAEGARVTIADIDAGAGHALEVAGRVQFVHCDVREESDVRSAVEASVRTFGRLDILFNNAGAGGTPDTLENMAVEAWDAAMSLLLRSAMLGIKHAVPALKASGGGAIINTSSVAGLRPGIGPVAYSVAKAAVIHLTRIAAVEFAASQIRVNAICPGVVLTPAVGAAFGASRGEADRLLPKIAQAAQGLQPVPRAGMPRDIAEACLYLASDSAGFVTGSEFIVDGGLMVKPPEGYSAAVLRIAQACGAAN